MGKIIKETTEKLSNGIITKDEADKILLDLFGVIKHYNKKEETSNELASRLGFPPIGHM